MPSHFHAVIILLIAIPSLQIGFELMGNRETKCMDVHIPSGYILYGSYMVTGINENNVRFYVHASLGHRRNQQQQDSQLQSQQL